jgi:hypothetical protein
MALYDGGDYVGKLLGFVSEERGVSWGITLRYICFAYIILSIASNAFYYLMNKIKRSLIFIITIVAYVLFLFLFTDLSNTLDKVLLLLGCGLVSFYSSYIAAKWLWQKHLP